MGGSWYKLFIIIILSFVNSWLFGVVNNFFSCWWMCSRVMLDIIKILLMIISFKFDSVIFICVCFWFDMGGRFLLEFFGMVKVVCIVVLLILIVVVFVGVINSIVGFLELVILCLKVFLVVWYIVLMRCDLLVFVFFVMNK